MLFWEKLSFLLRDLNKACAFTLNSVKYNLSVSRIAIVHEKGTYSGPFYLIIKVGNNEMALATGK
jgi:hypothetical protein